LAKLNKNPVFFADKIAKPALGVDSAETFSAHNLHLWANFGPMAPSIAGWSQISLNPPARRIMSLRIIGGNLRRRQLKTPPGITTRPYTDRVRQIVFDRIDDLVPDARIADIFAGVGTMGLEALSRGARSCVFIEADRDVHQSLRENVNLLAGDHPTVCWKTDVRYTSFAPKGSDTLLPYSLVFFDPPYAQCSMLESNGVLAKSLQRLAKPRITASDALLILRTPEKFDLPQLSGWQHDDCWHLSTMKIWSLRKPADVPAPDSPNQKPPSESGE